MELSLQDAKMSRCRVCFDENVELDWHNLLHTYSSLTYKDCYYKFTQLEYVGDDNFSTMLCRNCSNGLEYMDAFVSKAIETHEKIQQLELDRIIKDDEEDTTREASDFETILLEDIDIKPEVQNMCDENCEHFKGKSCNMPETSATLLQKIKGKKRKSTKQVPMTNSLESLNDGLTNDESYLDKRNSLKVEHQPICCSICSKVLVNKYKAIIHEKTHRENRERNEECVKCGLKFFDRGTLRLHMQTHVENREKPHKCEYCDKAFYNKGGLNVHLRIHLGQMIPCSLCEKEFFRQIDLDKHMPSHSAVRINSDIKLKKKIFVRCKDCGENVRSTNFKSHIAKHTNEPLFKCSICNKEFFARNRIKNIKMPGALLLSIVELKRKQLRNYKINKSTEMLPQKKIFVRCKDCGENVRSTNFKSHIAKHMNEPLFKCSICHKEYFARDSCVKHMNKIHKKFGDEAATLIISLKKERINHLFLQQYNSEEVKDK